MLKNNGNYSGVGGFINDPLEWKFLEGGGKRKKSSVGVWIFSGTTH